MKFGPFQLVVLEVKEIQSASEVMYYLDKVDGHEAVRLVDSVSVAKDEDGEVHLLENAEPGNVLVPLPGLLSGLLFGHWSATQAGLFEKHSGVLAGESAEFALTRDQLLEIADLIPAGSMALFLLIEHIWALAFRREVVAGGDRILASGWITPATLSSREPLVKNGMFG